METFGDKTRALIFAVLVHVLCGLLMFLGLSWSTTAKPVSVAGPIVEAMLVTAPPSRPRMARPRPQTPKPTPPPAEPPPPQPLPPEPLPVPPRAEDTVDQERIDREALEVAQDAEREQEERRKREQLLLEEQERLARMEEERQLQLDDIRRQREAAERRRRLEEDRLAQLQDRDLAAEQQRLDEQARMDELLADEQAQPQVQGGNEGTDTDLAARYAFAIQTAVTQNWLRPDTVQAVVCTVRIIQIPGGEVISAEVASPCDADEITRRSLEAAVLRAQPLPYQGYESVFQRSVNLNFCYPRTLCQG